MRLSQRLDGGRAAVGGGRGLRRQRGSKVARVSTSFDSLRPLSNSSCRCAQTCPILGSHAGTRGLNSDDQSNAIMADLWHSSGLFVGTRIEPCKHRSGAFSSGSTERSKKFDPCPEFFAMDLRPNEGHAED